MPVRLLLLPIPRGLLYLAQAISAVADPWMLLVAAVVVAIPVGLAAGGAPGAAALIGVAGIILLVLLAGVTLVVTTVVQLVVRDRRRGEIITLFFIVLLPMIGILPGVFSEERHDRMGAGERRREPHPVWATFQRIATATVPSELYVRTTRDAAQSQVGYRSLATLAGTAIVLHGVAFVVFSRVLSSPAISGSSQSRTRWRSRLPGVSARHLGGRAGPAEAGPQDATRAFDDPFADRAVRGVGGDDVSKRVGREAGLHHFETGVGLATFASLRIAALDRAPGDESVRDRSGGADVDAAGAARHAVAAATGKRSATP